MADLPFQAEYAKTGRAACKNCKEKIEQGDLRIARMVQSAFHDGKQPNWFHEECFFIKQRPTTHTDIGNFNKLRLDDQKKLIAKIEKFSGIVMPETTGKGQRSKAAKRKVEISSAALMDFAVEYSNSSRATCKHCDIKIVKDEVRVRKTVYDTEVGAKYGGQALWHHVRCFAEARNELLYFAGGEHLPGFNTLSNEDQKMVKSEIKPLKSDEVPVKKLKDEPKDAEELKEEKKKEKNMEKQNKLYFKCRDALSKLKKTDFHELLEHNSQEIPPGQAECLDRLADCMAFGALQPCPECKNGQLVLDTYGYKCTGNVTEWTKCCYVTQAPERSPFRVPDAYAADHAFKKFKPKVEARIFLAAAPPPVLLAVKAEAGPSVKKEIPIPPLKNLEFFVYGKLKSKEETKKRILKLGGLAVQNIKETLAAVVSNEKEIKSMNKRMMQIKEADIEVVDETFLDLIDPKTGTIANTLQLIKQHNIADWGSDPMRRVPQDVLDGKSNKSGSLYVKSSKSTVQKLKVHGGVAVDPDSGLDDTAHVYKAPDGTKYTVVLSKTDLVAQKNSYYKLQVLKDNNRDKFWLFRSWGRIGTTIGGNKLEDCKSLHDAIKRFEDLYMEKTENPWECRDNFMKVPDRYCPIDVDYSDDATDSKSLELTKDDNCTLHESVQTLIRKIFDINSMKKVLLEFELDTEKMPLGKLSKKQIKAGYKVLSELLEQLGKGETNQSKIVDCTNRFFTLIPHDFGMNNPPLLNNSELIKTKTDMLDNLLEIEIAYSMLKSDSEESSPITAHYKKLNAHIAPLEREAPEFAMIAEYLANTHAATHTNYKLEIEQVFKVVREGEDKRYKPFRKLHNRRLLWHGSRVTNFAGILSQGLRIAPPEAPVTGYMFGKGIYFADMVSKSANYCCTSAASPSGLLLLCEVALGNMLECTAAKYVEKAPKGSHSLWGRGRTQPDPARAHTLPDGTVVPLGKPVDTNTHTSLLYNEFIVYDVAQVNVKYLLQVKFNYNY